MSFAFTVLFYVWKSPCGQSIEMYSAKVLLHSVIMLQRVAHLNESYFERCSRVRDDPNLWWNISSHTHLHICSRTEFNKECHIGSLSKPRKYLSNVVLLAAWTTSLDICTTAVLSSTYLVKYLHIVRATFVSTHTSARLEWVLYWTFRQGLPLCREL